MQRNGVVKVNFSLEQAMKAQRGSSGIHYSFLNLGARWGWVVNATLLPFYLREVEPVLIVQEAKWVSVPVWTCAENLAPTGIRSPDCPACSESPY
jgi:hypothetical protein